MNDTPRLEGGQDRKFAFRDGLFRNRMSGEAIPADEPIVIFRARDNHAVPVLREYREMAQDPHHKQVISDRIVEFSAWRDANPDRVKEPGITHDAALSEATVPAFRFNAFVQAMLGEVKKLGGDMIDVLNVAARAGVNAIDRPQIDKPRTAAELKAIITEWLGQDCDWGLWETKLSHLVEDE